MIPKFYFTVHKGDMMRARLIKGCSIMLVASAHWDDNRKRFRINRPPADHVESISIDCGGFTAARRWGKYPWTFAQYADFIHETSRDVKLDFCAIMDYACEIGVDRSTYNTNIDRIKATIKNEGACMLEAAELPWLPVLQGNSLKERTFDLNLRKQRGMIPENYAGIGSVCGRGAGGAKQVVKFYRDRLPSVVKFHGFGMHIQALDDDTVFDSIRSWDSYGWNWGRGQKDMDRPAEYYRRKNESYSKYTGRLAELYYQNTVLPRLTKSRQLLLT